MTSAQRLGPYTPRPATATKHHIRLWRLGVLATLGGFAAVSGCGSDATDTGPQASAGDSSGEGGAGSGGKTGQQSGGKTGGGGAVTTPEGGAWGAAGSNLGAAGRAGGVIEDGTGGAASAAGGTGAELAGAADGGNGGASGKVCSSGPTDDFDQDGFTIVDGDCNDCDPNVNPGAFDVPGNGVDDNCNAVTDEDTLCDTGLAIDSVDPYDAARAIDICQTATLEDKAAGLINAKYVRANGAAVTPAANVGLLSDFGVNVPPLVGSRLFGLSTGAARRPLDPDYGKSLATTGAGTAPAGFPIQDACSSNTDIVDDIGLKVQLRVPSNATGFEFRSRLFVADYPAYVCTGFNDYFVAIVAPPPMGSESGNVLFDRQHNVESLTTARIDVCDAASSGSYASNCMGSQCPNPPNPYCPLGAADLKGTGFESGGATTWTTTQVPVVPRSIITVNFVVWDGLDSNGDSTALVDGFRWIQASD